MDIILLENIKGLTFNISNYISHKKEIFNSLLFLFNRYYDESRGDCLRCSKCCNDDRDVVESECIEKLGSQASMICSFHSSVNRCNIKSTPKFVPQSTNSSQSSALTTSNHTVVAFTKTSANMDNILTNTIHSVVRSRFASGKEDQNYSYTLITITLVTVVVGLLMVGLALTVSGICPIFLCNLRSLTHGRVDPGKSQSRILHVAHFQRPNKYIWED